MFFKRTKSMGVICIVVFAILAVRLTFIWGLHGASYTSAVQNQQQSHVSVKKLRGDITDRNGIAFTDRKTEILGITQNGFITTEASDSLYTFSSKKRAPRLASHIIGYTTKDGFGICGIEKNFDTALKNKGNISLSYTSTASGTPLDAFIINEKRTDAPTQVCLTLDYHIQKIAEEVMDKYIKKGAAVILDTNTFDVLAMVSRPNFDADGIDKLADSQNGELLNRAIMEYNAGSVFKIVTASAALENNDAYAKRYFDCHGMYELPGSNTFMCNNHDGHGILSFDDAFAYSCNCCFYVAGLEIGASLVMDTARAFGMGSKLLNTNLGERKGNLPLRVQYSPAETLNLSIGQGEILVTPLQCAVMTAVIANGGIRKEVKLVRSVTYSDQSYENFENEGSCRVIKSSTAMQIGAMMRECVLYGTGVKAASCPITIAGKTGSAQTGWIENGVPLVHGWFCGFFPYENPRYAMAILSEGGLSGADSCVEPFAEIAEKINDIYQYKQ